MLGNDISDPLLIKVEGMPKVKGFPGVSRGLKAIQVTQIIEREG
jgi:flagellar motor switch protein FliM